MQDLTERRLASEQLVDGKLLKVYRDQVRLPDGTASVREWIKHPGASAVVSLFPDGSTLLIRQFRYPPRRTFLEIPAGKIDKGGEAPEEVAVRELEEETGWRAQRFTALGAFYPCIGYSDEVIHIYLAEGLAEGRQNLESHEFVEVVRMPLEEAVALARSGAVEDMKSMVGLLRAEAYLATRDPEIMKKNTT